jgi:hypothetical protein
MKKRNGFVSNSSSASFIIRWTWGNNNVQKLTLEDAKCRLIPSYLSDESIKDCEWAKVKEALNRTVDKNIFYETSFWTSMYNDTRDFGEAASTLVMELLVCGFKVDVSVEED